MQGEWILRFLFTPPVNQDQLRSAETTQAVSCVSQTKYLIARIKFIHWFILGKIHNFRPFLGHVDISGQRWISIV